MKHLALFVAVALLAGCSAAQQSAALSSPAGQLFCGIQTAGGGTIIAGLVDAEATALLPAAAPVAILATGATKAYVDAACVSAATAVGGTAGIPVSPPANPAAVPKVAIVPTA